MENKKIKSQFLIGENFRYLLFETAIHYARVGFQVWYISNIPFDNIPDDIRTPENDVLKLITFLYLKDYKSLINHLNGVHLWRIQPRIIIIEGYEEFTQINEQNYKAVCGALVSSAILDACSMISKINETYLLITCQINENYVSRLKVLIDLYFPNILKHSNNEETLKLTCSFELK